MSAKIEPLVLQCVQHGDASHKHFVGLAETITTQINAQHSLYLRRLYRVGSLSAPVFSFRNHPTWRGLNLAPWPRLLQSMSPYLVLKVDWEWIVVFFFFFAFSLHSRRRQSQEPWYSIAKEIPLPEKQGRFQPRERQSWSSGVILLI